MLSRAAALGRRINYWPALLDVVTSTLMVFLLVGVLQTALDPRDVEAILIRNQQSRFLAEFQTAFEEELASGTVAVERHLDYLQITFSDRVLFRSASHRLQGAGERLLQRFSEVLVRARGSGYEQIQVEGHTDDLPLRRTSYPSDNWELSTARALTVVRHLSGGAGLSPDLFSANGYAYHRPVASNRTAAGRARNRRIELRLFFAAKHQESGGPLEKE